MYLEFNSEDQRTDVVYDSPEKNPTHTPVVSYFDFGVSLWDECLVSFCCIRGPGHPCSGEAHTAGVVVTDGGSLTPCLEEVIGYINAPSTLSKLTDPAFSSSLVSPDPSSIHQTCLLLLPKLTA